MYVMGALSGPVTCRTCGQARRDFEDAVSCCGYSGPAREGWRHTPEWVVYRTEQNRVVGHVANCPTEEAAEAALRLMRVDGTGVTR